MIYEGCELVELKFSTMQHWPEGKSVIVKEVSNSDPIPTTAYAYNPRDKFPWLTINVDGEWITCLHAAEIPTKTTRRVTRAECAGMAVQWSNRTWFSNYAGDMTEHDWNCPMVEVFTDRAATLADALAGRTLGMEVEG